MYVALGLIPKTEKEKKRQEGRKKGKKKVTPWNRRCSS
jgi:hypothetical protein